MCVSTLGISGRCTLELASVQRAIGVVVTAGPSLRTITVRSFIGGKFSDHKGVKRPLEEATAEGDKITAAATQKLASNAPVTDSDLDALLPDEGFETLAKPAAPEKNAAVTDADLDSILPDEGYEKKDAQPEG